MSNVTQTQANVAVELTIEQMKAAAKEKIAAKLKLARDNAELSLLLNEKFQDSMVNQSIREDATNKLISLDKQCEAIVSSMEVYSKLLKKVRTWNPNKRFGFGIQFSELSGLLSGIQYSVSEHNEQMLIVTGLTKDLIERTLNALGNLPYYNKNHNTIIEGTKTDIPELLECIQLIEHSLNITIDKSLITESVANRQFHMATIKAEGALAEAETTANMAFAIIR